MPKQNRNLTVEALLEIQLNNDPLIQDGKASKGLSEAICQLTEWLHWIESNEPTALSKYSGLIVIGRRDNSSKYKETISDILSSTRYSLDLLTYDDLTDSIDYILSRISSNIN